MFNTVQAYGMNHLQAMIIGYDYILLEAIFLYIAVCHIYLHTTIMCGIIDAVSSLYMLNASKYLLHLSYDVC
jgi:hypothetical protein